MNQLIDPAFWLQAFPNIFIAFTVGFWLPYLTKIFTKNKEATSNAP